MRRDSLTIRVARGFGWVFSISILTSMLQLAVLMVLARLLGPHEFGTVGAALVVVNFCQLLSQLGVAPAIIQRGEILPEHFRVGFTVSILLGVAMGLVVSTTAVPLERFLQVSGLSSVLKALALLFPVGAIAAVHEARLQRDMQFRSLGLIDLTSYVLGYAACGVLLAWLEYGAWALVGAQLAQAVVKSALLLAACPLDVRPLLTKQLARDLLEFGGGLSIARLGNAVAMQADNAIVGRQLGADALGVYGRVYQFLGMPANLLGGVVDKVLFPAMASVQGDRQRLGGAYLRALGFVGFITLPVSALLVILAPEIVHVLLGPRWDAAVLPFRVMAAATMFRASYKVSDSLARAMGAVLRSASRQWLYAVLVIAGAWVGHWQGLVGVAVGVSAAILVHYLVMLQLSVFVLGIPWSNIARLYILPIFVAAVFAGVGVMVASWSRGLGYHEVLVILSTCTSVIISGSIGFYVLPRSIRADVLSVVAQLTKRRGD
jgi:O-antigen/teichoic acid export membrane protein